MVSNCSEKNLIKKDRTPYIILMHSLSSGQVRTIKRHPAAGQRPGNISRSAAAERLLCGIKKIT